MRYIRHQLFKPARAGEQGCGFAVVADEVRTLAPRTQEATEEIKKIIESLQAQAGSAVSVIDQSLQLTKTSVQETAAAGQALQSIVQAVVSIRDMSNQIATAAEEQSSVAEEMDRNITSVADDTSHSTLSTVESMAEISSEIQTLRSLLSRFKTLD